MPLPSLSTRPAHASGLRSVTVARAPAAGDDAAVRARTDASIFAVAPVKKIVPALRARPRVVRNFVSREPVRRGQLVGDLIERACGLAIGNDEAYRRREARRKACPGSIVS